MRLNAAGGMCSEGPGLRLHKGTKRILVHLDWSVSWRIKNVAFWWFLDIFFLGEPPGEPPELMENWWKTVGWWKTAACGSMWWIFFGIPCICGLGCGDPGRNVCQPTTDIAQRIAQLQLAWHFFADPAIPMGPNPSDFPCVVLPWPREKWPATWWKTTCPTAPPWDGFSLPWNALQATINAPVGEPSETLVKSSLKFPIFPLRGSAFYILLSFCWKHDWLVVSDWKNNEKYTCWFRHLTTCWDDDPPWRSSARLRRQRGFALSKGGLHLQGRRMRRWVWSKREEVLLGRSLEGMNSMW